MQTAHRVTFTPVEGSEEILTEGFLELLVSVHDRFKIRVYELRAKRMEVLNRALRQHRMPDYLPQLDIKKGDWKVPPVPDDLKRPGIEISGPASITPMFINALNPGPEGIRAEGYLDDDEDSAGHRLIDTINATRNRLGAVERSVTYHDVRRDKHYSLMDGELPFFMHRERGLHLDESEVKIDDEPVSAAILGTSLTMYYCGQAQIERGQGVYFYLPKMESAEEAAFYKDLLDAISGYINLPDGAVIKAIPLIESLPAVYQMEEMLYELGPYAAGLNAARWDLKASMFEYFLNDSKAVWPDRFGVDIKTTEFLANIFRRLVAVCLKRGAVPIGGMATALPSKDQKINEAAAVSIRADKVWEAKQGFVRAWVAHIFHMKTAADPFKEINKLNKDPDPGLMIPERYPIEIKVPDGPITVEGTRRNVRILIEYLEGWLNGRGAKGIDSLAGKPGVHPALMEDLATGRMSVAQIAQRIIHGVEDTNTGQQHDFALIKSLLCEELEDILDRLNDNMLDGDRVSFEEVRKRYTKAVKIALRWIKNYTEFELRSLGSYNRGDLEKMASEEDAF